MIVTKNVRILIIHVIHFQKNHSLYASILFSLNKSKECENETYSKTDFSCFNYIGITFGNTLRFDRGIKTCRKLETHV